MLGSVQVPGFVQCECELEGAWTFGPAAASVTSEIPQVRRVLTPAAVDHASCAGGARGSRVSDGLWEERAFGALAPLEQQGGGVVAEGAFAAFDDRIAQAA